MRNFTRLTTRVHVGAFLWKLALHVGVVADLGKDDFGDSVCKSYCCD